jgi:hypothetical protein
MRGLLFPRPGPLLRTAAGVSRFTPGSLRTFGPGVAESHELRRAWAFTAWARLPWDGNSGALSDALSLEERDRVARGQGCLGVVWSDARTTHRGTREIQHWRWLITQRI